MKLIKKINISKEGKKYTNFYLKANGAYIAIKPAFIEDLSALKILAEEDVPCVTIPSSPELYEDKDENICF